MHFPAIIIAALSAGAHALPATNAAIGGDLSSSANPKPHDPVSLLFIVPYIAPTDTKYLP